MSRRASLRQLRLSTGSLEARSIEMIISESSKYVFLVLTVDGDLHFWWDQTAVVYQRVVAYGSVFVLACVLRSMEAVFASQTRSRC